MSGETPPPSTMSTTTTAEVKQMDDAAAVEPPPSRQELTELVRAIKFANPEASQRQVHKEITEVLAEKVSCLKDVLLQDVKKVWKKAVVAAATTTATGTEGDGGTAVVAAATATAAAADDDDDAVNNREQPLHSSSTNQDDTDDSSPNADLAERLRGTTPDVFTVGDGTQVYQQLAKDYILTTFSKQAAAEKEAGTATGNDNFVHVFLDVPANKSGERPHQALINFQQQKSGGKKNRVKQTDQVVDGKVIVKIQRAAPLSPEDAAQHPMLLYNHSRTLKTFVHPDPDDNGYETLANLIAEKGMGGVLGQSGGTKAYFYARLTKNKKGPNILSIEVTEMAPTQQW